MSDGFYNRILVWSIRAANWTAAVILVSVVACVVCSARWSRFVGLAAVAAAAFVLASWNERRQRTIFTLMALLSVIAQVLIIAFIELDYTQMTFDAWHVVRAALAVMDGREVDHAYFALYPYTQYTAYIWIGVFKFVSWFGGPIDVRILMVFNAVLIDVSILSTYRTAKMFLSRKGQYLFGIACAVSPVFVMFVPICYSDTTVVPFLTGGIYLMLRYIESSREDLPETGPRWILPIAGVLSLCLGFALKGCPLFAIVALTAYAFLVLPSGKWWRTAALICVGCLLGIVMVSQIESRFGLTTHEEAERTRLPMTHYIMMGLKDRGDYHDEDVCYTRSFRTLDEKREATVAEIGKRLNEMGPWGLLRQLYRKAVFTWGDGNCGASAYIGDDDHLFRRTFVHELVLSDGRFHKWTNLLGDSVYYLLLLFIVFGALKDARNCQVTPCWPLRMFLVACILFLLVWETHPRYTFHVRMVVILLGSMEASRMLMVISDRREKRRYNYSARQVK